MCIVVNLYGGPGTGKSTTAAELFAIMKKQGRKVELVTEYAKELVYDERHKLLEEDQLYIFAKQQRRMKRLHNKVDYIITDSPLFLSIVYGHHFNTISAAFENLVLEVYEKYDNLNIFIERDSGKHAYQEYGRGQTEAKARELDGEILSQLGDFGINYEVVTFCNDSLIASILDVINKQENK